ncbi:hypothetical protein HPB47_028422 [Ixodes persulcatus]|uniref:Uncharacterized protein n=1 Tax=Ixodes persulcatus TaxID=34615 RepID=A0AC60PT78_IXOPE|nr:hypothetical protein HPB47_028422 [Ixodes persulcatus]
MLCQLHITRVCRALVFHVGTNDLADHGAAGTLERYGEPINAALSRCPYVERSYVTLVLPRFVNRRRGVRNNCAFVTRFNWEAKEFNDAVKERFRRSQRVFYLDHGLLSLPPARVLAADGLHQSFEGVALISQHLSEWCLGTQHSRPPHPILRHTLGPAGTTNIRNSQAHP